MSLLNDKVREILEGPYLGHFVTVNRDGSPQVSIVWVGLEKDEIVTGHFRESLKVRNARRDPRVVVSFENGVVNDEGLHEYLVIHGEARVEAGGAPELLTRLSRTYLGPDADYPPMPNPPPGFVMRIRPTRVHGIGPFA